MQSFRRSFMPGWQAAGSVSPRSYGSFHGAGPDRGGGAGGRHGGSRGGRMAGRGRRAAGARSWPWAIRSPPAWASRPSAAFPARLEKALTRQGPCGRDRQCRGFRRHRLRRPCPARLVGAGGDRRGHRRARRQRHAARRRSEGHAQGAGGDRAAADRAAHCRCCSPACGRRPISATDYVRDFEAIYPDLASELRPAALSLLPRRRRRRTPGSISATGCIRPPPASTGSSRASCPRPRSWWRACATSVDNNAAVVDIARRRLTNLA